MSAEPWLVLGLGNPGAEYAGNRHNIGFMVVEELAARAGSRFRSHRARADVAEAKLIGDEPVPMLLAKPRSYMNESGGPTAGLLAYYKVPPSQLVVIHDELDLSFDTLRVKFSGGDNGHNGLKSIRRSTGTGDFHRVRCGIGRPPGRRDPADHVLRDFAAGERNELPHFLVRAADAVEVLLRSGLTEAQQRYNS